MTIVVNGISSTNFSVVNGTNIITLSSPVFININQICNFVITNASCNFRVAYTNQYAGGSFTYNGTNNLANYDMYFKTYVTPLVFSWQNLNELTGGTITETDPKFGTLTNNKIPKWNGTTLADGIITDNGTSVGIGVAPTEKLDVAGKTKTTNLQVVTGTAPTVGQVLTATDTAGNMSWATVTGTTGATGAIGGAGAIGATGATGAQGTNATGGVFNANLFNNVSLLTSYNGINGTTTSSANEANVETIIPFNCTIDKLSVSLRTNSNVANTLTSNITITLVKNGVDTTLTVGALTSPTAINTYVSGSNTTNTVTLVAGDRVTFKVVQTNGTPAVRILTALRYF